MLLSSSKVSDFSKSAPLPEMDDLPACIPAATIPDLTLSIQKQLVAPLFFFFFFTISHFITGDLPFSSFICYICCATWAFSAGKAEFMVTQSLFPFQFSGTDVYVLIIINNSPLVWAIEYVDCISA